MSKDNVTVNPDVLDEYEGIACKPVTVYDESGNSIYSYVVPWYENGKQYDNGLYFQEYGGWGLHKIKVSGMTIHGLESAVTIDSIIDYSETQNRMKFAVTIDNMLAFLPSEVKEGDICYVSDIVPDSLQERYNPSGEIEDVNPSHYFVLRNISHLTVLGKTRNGGEYGWQYISVSEILNGSTDAGRKVIYFETVKERTDGTKLTAGSKERKYILTYQITGISSFRIQQIFGIDSAQSFYEMNQAELENREFVYRGDYYFVNGEGKLQVSWKGEQRNYLRIGTDYYKKIAKMGPNGQTEFEIVKWSEKNIKDDFHSSKEFLKNIVKCDAFANVPENDPDKYRQIITSEKEGVKSVLYNRYSPIYHVPKEGDWRTINKLLHHIFDYKNLDGEPMYEFALDYIQLLYTRPTKHLPILCLVSTERGTGKTTFLEMLKAVFVENMRILDSARLTSNFNGSWAGKLIVAVDESFINMDEKNGAANKLKMIATNETIPSEAKGKDSDEIPNFSKLILCSNDEYNFVRIDWEENRYAIIKVGSIPENELNPHMRDNLREEIPAFLYFLKNRQLYYKEKSRLYFEERVFMTPQLEMIQARTEGGLARNIKDVIRNQFYLQQAESVRLSLAVIEELVRLQYKFSNRIQIRDYLNDKGYKTGVPTSFTYYMYAGDDMGITKKDRCYTFNMYDFLTPEEIADLQNEKI